MKPVKKPKNEKVGKKSFSFPPRKMESWAVEKLKPYARNARTHSDEQVSQIAASISEFGFTNPILVDDAAGIVAGHGRLLAAQKLGLDKVPVIVLTGLTDSQRRAYIIADNKLALNAGWDFDVLAAELDILRDADFDLSLLGFEPQELNDLIGTPNPPPGLTDEDAAPAIPAKPISKRGDVWILGPHRVMCGDSTSATDVEKLMAGKKGDMIFTDPPYGVSIGDKNKMLNSAPNGKKGGRNETNIESDTLSPEALYPILKAAFVNGRAVLSDCGAAYVASPQGGGLGMMMMMMMKDSGLEVRHILNWVKNNATFSMGRLDYDYQHEPILFTWKKTHKKIMAGEHKTSCWFINKPQESKLHPTMKPVAIPENAMLNSSEAGDTVLDLFGGAGSTLIACEKTGRINRSMEIDPKYCDVIVRRWQEYMGKKAMLESTGKLFDGKK